MATLISLRGRLCMLLNLIKNINKTNFFKNVIWKKNPCKCNYMTYMYYITLHVILNVFLFIEYDFLFVQEIRRRPVLGIL